jgi:signal transduction histidine kinase
VLSGELMGAAEVLAVTGVLAAILTIAFLAWLVSRGRAPAAVAVVEPWPDAFAMSVLAVESGAARLVSGEASFADSARALGVKAEPQAVLDALSDSDKARRLKGLLERGEPCAFHAAGPKGSVGVEGRTTGAVAWLRLSAQTTASVGLPTAERFAGFLDAQSGPAWIVDAAGRLTWANQAWLQAAEAASVDDAVERQLAFDAGAEPVVREVLASGQKREALRWAPVQGKRRAFHLTAEPLDGGAVGALALDVTEQEETREALKRHVQAHDETLNRLADAVAIFTPAKDLSFHNTAFAEMWNLEPAWLNERPTHGEILDRLRQRRRLPETADYAKWKAEELSHYQDLGAAPDDLWTLPGGRTLRVVRQPHPLGGLLVLFSDVTDELRLKAQYNALIQVQQATLDKLNDAVAVFGSDGRLRLHNEAFERFWNVTAQQLDAAGDFDGLVELCLPRLHDLQFWRDMKARVGDPDPHARVAVSGEARTSDQRIVAFQSRPLPDGATLIAFTDVTDTRQLERAVAERSAALLEAERLKRDFVGNVSYELRTPLTTILGYSELLESMGEALPERGRSHVGAVRTAASQLARSIDDVLDMAQIDADEMALDPGDVGLASLLNEAAERWRPEAEPAEVRIEVECAADVGLIRGDRRRLGQVLDHLIDNAVRQSPPQAVVTVSAKRALSEVQIEVTDQGRGIPFHVQAHIFDRFVGRDRGGPGLGLALVKALVELHGGWVALESEPGKGAKFTLHLPETAALDAGAPELF